jgi:BMFP domain-containing protein YqiC
MRDSEESVLTATTPKLPKTKLAGVKNKKPPTPSPTSLPASKILACDFDYNCKTPTMSLETGFTDHQVDLISQIVQAGVQASVQACVQASMQAAIQALGDRMDSRFDEMGRIIGDMRRDYATLADKVSALEVRLAEVEKPRSVVRVPVSSETQHIESDASNEKRRTELMLSIRRKCELLVLRDSIWDDIDVRGFGNKVHSFAYTMRCSTLEFLPSLIPRIIPDIDPVVLKGVVISTGINDVEAIGVQKPDDISRSAEYQSRITKAIASVKAAWPEAKIFFDMPSPILEPVTAVDVGKPRQLRPGCVFATDKVYDTAGAELIAHDFHCDAMRGAMTDLSVYFADGKHLAGRGKEMKVNAIVSKVVGLVPHGSNAVHDLRDTFRELRYLNQSRSAQQQSPQFNLTKVAQSLAATAETILKMAHQSTFTRTPPAQEPWGPRLGYYN